MIVSIHQPQYIPWIPYFTKIRDSDIFVFLDDVQFQKNGMQNRNSILGNNGELRLTIPVSHTSTTKINEVTITDQKILTKHWKSIEQNYSKSPYFEEFSVHLKPIYDKSYTLLNELNISIIKAITEYLAIPTTIMQSSSITKTGEKSDLILDICKNLNAQCYLSGSGGISYLDKKMFADNKIKIETIDYRFFEYSQQKNIFHPKLSIIDLIFNQGTNSINLI
jgi:hypothetical protein